MINMNEVNLKDLEKYKTAPPVGGGYGGTASTQQVGNVPGSNFAPVTDPNNPPVSTMPTAQPNAVQWQESYQRPSWLGNAYLKTPYMSEESGVNIMQDWWRNPQWGGHVAWNPYWGFQDRTDVQKMYEEYGDQMPWEQFTQLGLTQQEGPNWQQYFPDREAIYAGQNQQQAATGGTPWQMPDWWNQYFGGQTGGQQYGTGLLQESPEGGGFGGPGGVPPPGVGGVPPTGDYGGQFSPQFPFPPEWDVAGQTMANFAQGLPTAVPPQWDTATDVATQAAQTGLPVDYSKWWEAQQPMLQRGIEDQARQAAEQFGMGGLRWSTPLQRNISDIAGRETQRTFADYMGRALGGEEAARQRQMSGIGALTGLGGGYAGLAEAAKNRGLTAAQSLVPLGQSYLQAPQDWAKQMYGMGAAQQGISQGALDRIYQDFLRMAPEMSPWLAQAMGLAGMQSQMVPQQYQPSFLSQLLGLGGQLGSAALLGG